MKVRQSLLRKSAEDRKFFDCLCFEIWCQCRKGGLRSSGWQEWCDMLLPCYSNGRNAITIGGITFNTPRQKLSVRELDAIQSFISTHTFADVADAKQQLAEDLFNDCIAISLNVLDNIYKQNH